MAEVKPSTSRGEDAAELAGEASCSGADGSTFPESVPPSIAAECPSFLTWMWIQILTACSRVWGARGGGWSGPRTSGPASGAQLQRTQEDSDSEVLSQIAASKKTWSEVPGRGIHHPVSVPCSSDLSVWEELKESAPDFFGDWDDDRFELGHLIAEGGQAEIYEAKLKGREQWDLILKVFKLGVPLADLKCQWSRCMRKDDGEGCSESRSMQERSSKFVFEDVWASFFGEQCFIFGATLLKDGRFAFLMSRYWGDLRTLIDLRVETLALRKIPWGFDLTSKYIRDIPLFSFSDFIRMTLQIADGMQGLHAQGVLHRDLKAANVLIDDPKDGIIICAIADYECAMFVQGTRFWRAPEVLKELQKSSGVRNEDIWTEQVDVYSFGMTCYEILTGQIPFVGYTKSKWGDVIRGERPSLLDYVFPKLRELVEACWHTQPSQRPSFLDIMEKLASLNDEYSMWF